MRLDDTESSAIAAPRIALLFPGQGGYDGEAFAALWQSFPIVEQTFEEIDATTRRLLQLELHHVLHRPGGAPSLGELLDTAPDALQFAIFGLGVAIVRLLDQAGIRPDCMVGHSFGEIAALTAAGTFTLAQGTEVVAERVLALRSLGDDKGRMAAVQMNEEQTRHLVALVGSDELAIAAVNAPEQMVLSGRPQSLAKAQQIANTLKRAFYPLHSPYAFHFPPLMEPARSEFSRRLSSLRPAVLKRTVYSPILGRAYAPIEPLGKLLAEHLVRPVRFADAIKALQQQGVTHFIECGAGDVLCRLVAANATPSSAVAWPTLLRGKSPADTLGAPIAALRRELEAAQRHAQAEPDPRPRAIDTSLRQAGNDVATRHAQEAGTWPSARTVSPIPAASGAQRTSLPARPALFGEMAELFAQALEYPTSVFTEAVELEADLAIDSVKQMELMGRLRERYDLPPLPESFRLNEYRTFGAVVDLVASLRSKDHAKDTASASVSPARNGIAQETLRRELVTLFATRLEYPESVFTDQAELEADLAIDSVKRMELLGEIRERYQLPPLPEDFRLTEYRTLGAIVSLIAGLLDQTRRHAPGEPPVTSAAASTVAAAVSPSASGNGDASAHPLPPPSHVPSNASPPGPGSGPGPGPAEDTAPRNGHGHIVASAVSARGAAPRQALPDAGAREGGLRDDMPAVVHSLLGGGPPVVKPLPVPTPRTTQDLAGKVALVTGSGRGLGKVIARKLVERGAQVVLNYFHSKEAATATYEELKAQGGAVELVRASTGRRDQVARMFEEIAARHPRLDLLINNAADGAMVPVDAIEEEYFDRALRVNVKGVLWCSQAALPLMRDEKQPGRSDGVIVNVSSLGSERVLSDYLVVGVAKAALQALTRYLAVAYAPWGIRVNSASAGLIDSEVIQHFPRYERMRRYIETITPLGRLGSQEELAELVLFLCSPASSWITGQTLLADGGVSLVHDDGHVDYAAAIRRRASEETR